MQYNRKLAMEAHMSSHTLSLCYLNYKARTFYVTDWLHNDFLFVTNILKISQDTFNQSAQPANTKHLYNICTMLEHLIRRWSNIVQMLYKCFVFAWQQVYSFF